MKKILILMAVLLCVVSGCSKPAAPKQDEDVIQSHSWIAGDNSNLVFNGEKFIWYQSKTVLDNNYYSGTSQVYYGEAAKKFYLDFFSDYGLDGTEQLNTSLAQAKANGVSEEPFTVLVLHNEKAKMDGEELSFEPYDSVYVGYNMEKDGVYVLDFMNLSTGNRASFTRE